MIIRKKSDNEYNVYYNDKSIGTVLFFYNPHHMKNCYIKLSLDFLDNKLSKELFSRLRKIAGCPLQIMSESDDTEVVAFLTSGGFICKRKCYEVEAEASDYMGELKKISLSTAVEGETEYTQVCKQMYEYYIASHEKINPYTAGFEAFCKELPKTVIYAKSGIEIISLAFVENNEIAYVCGKESKQFKEFAQSLVTFMFSKYKTICFESDDCDWAAMVLRFYED